MTEKFYRVLRDKGNSQEKAKKILASTDPSEMSRRSYVYWFLLSKYDQKPIPESNLYRLFGSVPRLTMSTTEGLVRFDPTFQDNIEDLIETGFLEEVKGVEVC